MKFPEIIVGLPNWVSDFLPQPNYVYATVEERMNLVIQLAKLNVKHQTGGPFGAAIFEQKSGRLIAPGLNLVIPTSCAIAHAEIISISISQKIIGHFDLGAKSYPPYELISSAEPCAMCLGAILWSGIRHLVCGSRDEDVRKFGFDEGPKAPDWIQYFKKCGINVVQDVLRSNATMVLQEYHENGGLIYNARQGAIINT